VSTRDRLTPGTDVDADAVDAPRRLAPGKRNLTHQKAGGFGAGPGKLTLTRHLNSAPVPLPYQSELEAAFGVSLADVEAYVGESEGLGILGARAAAEANVVAFADDGPAREVVAHEIVHVLQARRSSGRGDPEAEADAIEAQVAAGQRLSPVMAAATGILHKNENEAADANTLPPLTEDELRLLEYNIALELPYLLRGTKALEEGPYGNYIKADPLDFWFEVVKSLKPICGPSFVRIMAPDTVPKLTDTAARRGWQEVLTWVKGDLVKKKEPGAFYEDSALIWDIANAITRRWNDSIKRVLPRWVKMAIEEVTVIDDKGKEHKETREGSASASSITAAHPMDVVVADALSHAKVESLKFRADNPELVAQAQFLYPRPVTVTFPADRGLFHWAEANPPDATAEEVALALFGKTDQAYRLIPLAPLFGFRRDAVDDFKSEKRDELHKLAVQYGQGSSLNQREVDLSRNVVNEALSRDGGTMDAAQARAIKDAVGVPDVQWGLSTADIDPMAELSASQGGGRLATDRARAAQAADKKEAGKKHDDLAVYDRLKENLALFEQVKKNLGNFSMCDGDVTSRGAAMEKRLRQSQESCLADPEGWYALANQQNKVLGRIARGAGETSLNLLMFGGVNKDEGGTALPDPNKLPEGTRGPVLAVARAFHDAAVALDFADVADERCTKAEELLRNLTISIMEVGLKQSNPIIVNALMTQDDRHKDTASYDPKEMEDRSKGLYGWMARLRVQMGANPAEGQKKLSEVTGQVSDLQFEVAVVANLEALDAVWRPLANSHDFWQSLADWARTSDLQTVNRNYYNRFKLEVWDPYKSGDAEKKKAAKKAFEDLSKEEDFTKHFERVKSALEDDASHKKWAKIIVAIAVAIVAFGLGQWAGAALALEGLELAIVAGTVELGANAALNKLIFDENPTIAGLVTGFLFNVGMFAVMARAARVGKAAGMAAEIEEGTVAAARETSKLAKAGQKVWQITKEGIFANVLGMVQMEVQTLAEKGRFLKREELEEMFINNTVQWIGFSVGTRAVDPLLPPHARHGRQNGIDIEGLIKEREAITKLAKQAEESRDPALGKQLVERERAYLEREQKVREQLVELAKKRPELFKSGEADQLRANALDDPHAREMMQAQALLGLEEIGPGLYRADAKAMDAVLHQHKASDGKIVGIETDPHSGLRTVTVQPVDGPPIQIKERLGEGGERAAPLGSPADARAFESWMATAELHKTDPVMGESYRERLREYYARDPEGALKLASDRYGYAPANHPDASPVARSGEPPPPRTTEVEAGKAFEQYRYQKEGDPKVSNPGETTMNRGDFEAMYKAGFEYDPIRRDWVSKGGVKAGTTGAPHAPAGGNADALFVGHIHSEAVGVAVLQKLAYGEVEALRVAGVNPPEGLNSQAVEWGLMKNPKDGSFILVRGGKGAVDFAAFPGYDAVGHTHPLYDPHPKNGVYQKRELQGKNGDGILDAKDLANTATWTDLVYLVPSTGDLGYLSLTGLSHRVKTPFVHLGDGKIGNPTPGMMADGIDFIISNPKPIGVTKDGKQFVVYEADITIMAGDTPIHSDKLYQYYADYGTARADQPSFTPPAYDPLPANHPLARLPEIARAGHTTAIGQVQPRTLDQLQALKIIGPEGDPALQANITRILGELSPEAARDLSTLAAHQTLGNASGLEGWFRWAAEMNKSGKDLVRTLADMRQANRMLAEDPGSRVKLGGDAVAEYRLDPRTGLPHEIDPLTGKPKDPTAQKASSFDLERTRSDGVTESIEFYRMDPKKKKTVPSASDVTEGLSHAADKAKDRSANKLAVGQRIVAVVELPLPFETNLRGGGKRKIDVAGNKTLEVAADGPSAPPRSEGNLFTDTGGEGVLAALAAKADNQLVHEVQVTDYSGTVLITYVRDTTTNTWSIKT
jgi:hypothetical protein